jgi:hypothetical protein
MAASLALVTLGLAWFLWRGRRGAEAVAPASAE